MIAPLKMSSAIQSRGDQRMRSCWSAAVYVVSVMAAMVGAVRAGEKRRLAPWVPCTHPAAARACDPVGMHEGTELSDFLRGRRAAVAPERVGIADDGRRRVPGLRREELADLAGLSLDYYVRLEQGRETNPSPSVLDALAVALRLSEDERLHLHALVDAPQRRRPSPGPERVRPSVRALVDALDGGGAGALVVGRHFDLLAVNPVAGALLGIDPAAATEHNLLRMIFLDPRARTLLVDWDDAAAGAVAWLRRVSARRLCEDRMCEIVDEVTAASLTFARLYAAHDVRAAPRGAQVLDHPAAGQIALTYDVLSLGDSQALVTLTPADAAARATLAGLMADADLVSA